MNIEWILLTVCLLFLLLIIGLIVRFRREVKKKDEGLISGIREEGRLAKEVERLRIEKATLENLLKDRTTTGEELPKTNPPHCSSPINQDNLIE